MIEIQELSPERFARLFHRYHEALAPDFACASDSGAVSWPDLPENERHRLVAAIRLTIMDMTYAAAESDGKRYFAKPGEAEWGA